MPRRNAKTLPADGPETPGVRVRTAATRLFAERGFAGSSLRDLARASGMSLAGLYHHFDSKDTLLFELQRDAYERLMQPLNDISADAEPLEKLEALVQNHLRFFAADITAMKVLSHEAEALDGDLGDRVRRMRRKYYNHFLSIVTELLRVSRRKDLNPRVATMTLFGMINWIYTWYKPATDGPPDRLASQMVGIFLNGLDRGTKGQAPAAPRAQSRRRAKKEDGQ
jgi:AcrR family transcriptional regulator